jgi:Family of unknown function (DUF5519)
VDVLGESHGCFADRALEQLRSWPALDSPVPDDQIPATLLAGGQLVVAVQRPDEADLHLTWPVIERISEALLTTGQVRFEPDSDWVRVHLGCDTDIAVLTSLVSLAIQASTQPAAAAAGSRSDASASLQEMTWSSSVSRAARL